jgi:hypothetical protein
LRILKRIWVRGKLRDEVGKLTKQREDTIIDKNEAIAKQAKAERKANQETEARAKIQGEHADLREKIAKSIRKANQEIETRIKIQGEHADLREKIANSIRKESKTAEKSAEDTKRIRDLELEVKTLKEEKLKTNANSLQNNTRKRAKKQTPQKKRSKQNDQPNTTKILQEFVKKIKTKESKVAEIKPKKELKILGKKPLESDYSKPEKSLNQELKTDTISLEKQIKYAEKHKPKPAEFVSSEKPVENKTQVSDSTSGNSCGYHFGYLSERDKGEAIPNACVECSKSLDCMLSKVHQSIDSVVEIKKWYHFK